MQKVINVILIVYSLIVILLAPALITSHIFFKNEPFNVAHIFSFFFFDYYSLKILCLPEERYEFLLCLFALQRL